MGKDYFSDINPNEATSFKQPEHGEDERSSSEKSIRNISVSPRRSAMTQRMMPLEQKVRMDAQQPRKNLFAHAWVWVIAAAFILIAVVVSAVLVFAGTTKITVTPRVHEITFDPSTTFTAYPDNSGTDQGIVYSTETIAVEESKTIPANGVEKAEDRASGAVTIFNAYSDKPSRLIKNTRFESPEGLVYRIPASVEVPGKKGATPGQITVTVFADQAGAQYNIGPTERFTVPGLKSTPDMYNGIYARSSAAFTGGFSGDKPAVLPASLESARAELRTLLDTKIKERISSLEGFAFESLAQVQYESLPTVADPAGGAKVTEKAVVMIPVFPSTEFASSIARAVSADAGNSKVSLQPKEKLVAQPSGTLPELGTAPILFGLSGQAIIVWDIDADAIRQALAGKEQSAFKPIIANFLGVKDAEARPPFWTTSFPSAEKIEIEVINPTSAQ